MHAKVAKSSFNTFPKHWSCESFQPGAILTGKLAMLLCSWGYGAGQQRGKTAAGCLESSGSNSCREWAVGHFGLRLPAFLLDFCAVGKYEVAAMCPSKGSSQSCLFCCSPPFVAEVVACGWWCWHVWFINITDSNFKSCLEWGLLWLVHIPNAVKPAITPDHLSQLPPQWTVDGKRRVRNESTPLKETSLPAHIYPQRKKTTWRPLD